MKSENTYNTIEEILNIVPGNFKILEETIDVEIQKDFYESSKQLIINPETDNLSKLIQQLNGADFSINEKKIMLQKLAMIDSVEAYRAIEEYHKEPLPELKEWATLSLQQSQMVMHSSLLDEQQVFISTGLGGKNNMLRYYIIFPYLKDTIANDTQKRMLKEEVIFFLTQNQSEFEEIEYHEMFAAAMVLIPLTAPIPEIIKSIMKECNQFGLFLDENVMITNIKKFNTNEILDIIQNDEK